MLLDVVGVHPVPDAPEPCHLVEIVVTGKGSLDISSLTQETPGSPRSDWQAPYDEHIVEADGKAGRRISASGPVELQPATRVVFFFHYLMLDRPLETPAGSVLLPSPTPRPRRLGFMRYDPP